MSNLFQPKSEDEFFKEVDHSLEQAEKGERLDAYKAVKEMTEELEAGYKAMIEAQRKAV